MGLFSGPDVAQLKADRDFRGLADALGNRKARDEAIEAIAELGSPDAVLPVMSQAAGAKPATLAACGEALQRLGRPAVDGLLQVIEDDPDGQALRAAAGLGELDPALATPALRELAGSEDPMRRVYAGVGAGALGTDEAVDMLAGQLDDDELVVRINAVGKFGLPATGNPKAQEALRRAATHDPEQPVRELASGFVR